MGKRLLILLYFACRCWPALSQSVGIGTGNPNAKAILDIKATDRGVLFPRLSTVQRNAISNPPDGLHIFNTDDRCLNYYDSANAIWNCYCASCQTVVINITSSMCKVDFYALYGKGAPGKKYLINISAGVTISGCHPGDTALSFSSMPFDASVVINNYGTIQGAGGSGGNGAIEQGCSFLSGLNAGAGGAGGYAVSTRSGVGITINNYGMVAGGGGGGGGSGASGSGGNTVGYGGGGGGGAGIAGGAGGLGGGIYTGGGIIPVCVPNIIASGGSSGTATAGGAGAPGNSGGAAGGSGGGWGQSGQNGTGDLSDFAIGGAAGKAIGGGSGNTLININGGQYFGVVD